LARSQLSAAQAKQKVLEELAQGHTVAQACKAAGRSIKAHENWRSGDKVYARKVDEIRAIRKEAKDRGSDPDAANLGFEEWRLRFLGQKTYPHQRVWIDVLEGREPADLHESMTYEKGDPSRVLVNVPPNHGKTMTMTIEYVTYRIATNPNLKVIVVSKTQTMAKDFLYAIKQRLTSHRWAPLQAAYGGVDGFRGKEAAWSADRIYLSDELRDSGEKDPTVQAIGMGGQIYGARADLIIVDDAVVLSNAGEYEKQMRWLTQEVASRLPGGGGRLLVIGTRVAPVDLYSELRSPERYVSGKSPWTYLACPAVLDFAEDPAEWKTLWPKAGVPWEGETTEPDEDGDFPRWDGPHLNRVRDQIPATQWALVYMQQEVSEDSVFHPKCVMGSIQGNRRAGPLVAGAWGHPRNGMEGMYVVASMDPAMTGDTFAFVGCVDRASGKRYALNAWCQTSPTPAWIRDLIKSVTEEYAVNEWVIETNAFQLFLTHDEDIQNFLRQRGVKLTPHYTGRNKQDPDFGVASLAPLFGSLSRMHDGSGRADHQGDNLIELPRIDGSYGLKTLVEELITWQPGKLGKQLRMDGPMSLWFFELRVREVLGVARRRTSQFLDNPYLSRGDRKQRVVIPMGQRYATE
jgi:hypothetical protein